MEVCGQINAPAALTPRKGSNERRVNVRADVDA
jgi:hypothetical protein